MQKYADYIKQIEIDALWSGRKHIIWDLDRQVNILSGVNGVGKSTILNKVVKGLSAGGDFPSHLLKGVHLKVEPEDARLIRFDIIRSFDRPIINSDAVTKMGLTLATEMDWQIFLLQRKYLDYQVNIGNRIIATLQSGEPDAAEKAQALSQPKKNFQDIMDSLFAETGKKIIRTENEIKFTQIGETLLPYQLSSGEKQILVILLTVLVEDQKNYVLFMDEPEVSLHVEWQKQLIDLILRLNPNVQIILTTHSPAVIMNGWMDKVTSPPAISRRPTGCSRNERARKSSPTSRATTTSSSGGRFSVCLRLTASTSRSCCHRGCSVWSEARKLCSCGCSPARRDRA